MRISKNLTFISCEKENFFEDLSQAIIYVSHGRFKHLSNTLTSIYIYLRCIHVNIVMPNRAFKLRYCNMLCQMSGCVLTATTDIA